MTNIKKQSIILLNFWVSPPKKQTRTRKMKEIDQKNALRQLEKLRRTVGITRAIGLFKEATGMRYSRQSVHGWITQLKKGAMNDKQLTKVSFFLNKCGFLESGSQERVEVIFEKKHLEFLSDLLEKHPDTRISFADAVYLAEKYA